MRFVRRFLGAVVDRGADHFRGNFVALEPVMNQLPDRGDCHQQDDRTRPRGGAKLVDFDVLIELE